MTTNLGPWPGNLYPPVRAHATANITPFTYYDGLSFLEVLEALRAWLRETLIPGLDGIIEIVDGMIQDALENVEIDLEVMRQELNDALASIELTDTELRAYVDDVLQQVIDDSIELQAEVVKGIEKAVFGRVTLEDYLDGNTFREALLAALADVPDNGTIYIPSGDYTLDATVDWPVTKNVTIDGNNAKVVSSVSGYAFDFVGAYEAPVQVTDLLPTIIPQTTDGTTWTTSPMNAVTFNAGTVTGWRRGDIVKIVSDDALEGQRDQGTSNENPNSQGRYGQHMQVESAVGSMVTLIGDLREAGKYASNIRAARLPRGNRVTVRNLTVEMPSEYYTPGDQNAVSGIRFMDMYRPELSGFEIQGHNAAITFNSCYAYLCADNHVGLLRNRVAATAGGGRQNYGYGVIDIGSEYGKVTGNTFNQSRHGYTDDSGRGIADRDVGRYGRTFGTIVANNTAYACSNAPYDTHAHSDSVTFTDNAAASCNGGVQLRGIRHVVDGLTVRDAIGSAINIIDEGSAWGWSHSHVVSNVSIDGAETALVVRFHQGGPFDGERETRPIRLNNIHARRVIGHSAVLASSTVYADNVSLQLVGASDNGYGIFNLDGAEFVGRNIHVDVRGAGPMSHAVFRVQSGVLNVDDYSVRFDAESTPSNLLSTGTTSCILRHGWLTGRLSSASPTGNMLSWVTSAGLRPSQLAKSGAAVETSASHSLMAQDVDAPTAILLLNADGADRVVGGFANAPVDGQRMIIINTGAANTVTINHGAAANTQNRGSAAVVLAPNQEMEWVFYGVWRQLWAL